MTPHTLSEIKARAEKATPGPWVPETGCSQCLDEDFDLWYGRGPLVKVVGFDAGKKAIAADAAFIAASRSDIPALLALCAELLEIADTLDDYVCHSVSATGRPCETERSLKYEDCNCGLREIEERASKFTTPEWREAANALRPPQEPPR